MSVQQLKRFENKQDERNKERITDQNQDGKKEDNLGIEKKKKLIKVLDEEQKEKIMLTQRKMRKNQKRKKKRKLRKRKKC